MEFEYLRPDEIEARSMEIIMEELGERRLIPEHAPVIRRVIHTTADFSYADTLFFSENAVEIGKKALRAGQSIVTDTQMARAGINKRRLAELGGQAYCFMSDAVTAELAKQKQTTRAAVSMERAVELGEGLIFAIGNAPTALMKLSELIQERRIKPALIIAVPVGFVNVVPAKEQILSLGLPCIVARGRKGGSNVAAAICNALLMLCENE